MLRPAQILRNERLASWLSARPLQMAIVICAAWILIGLVGHDPWKSDEAYTFGAAYSMLESGDWLVPRIGDTPLLQTPPLVHYGAAISALVLPSFIPLHDAARLSLTIWLAVVLGFTALTARELWAGNRTWIAPLMLIGCTGLLVRGHQLISAVALLSAIAIGLYGLALAPRRWALGGIWIGLGIGTAFLSTGVADPLMLVVTIVVMAVVSPRYRNAQFARSLALAIGIAAPIIMIWPLLLYLNEPGLYAQWSRHSVGSLRDLLVLSDHDQHLYFLDALPWFAWPAWLFAVWSLWIEGKEGLSRRELQLPLVAFLVIFGYLSLAGEGRDVVAMPMLLPLALLASIAIDRLPRGALNAYYWFGIMVATVFSIIAWIYFSAAQYGFPTRLAEHIFSLQPAYQPQPRILAISLAIVVSVIWLVLVFNFKRSTERPFILWAAGMTTGWALAVLLLFHWIDARKTYRSMVVELTAHLPQQHHCIISHDVADATLAMLHYFGGVVTSPVYSRDSERPCDLLITQDRWGDGNLISTPWTLIWEGGRPGDRHERYRLYQRVDG